MPNRVLCETALMNKQKFFQQLLSDRTIIFLYTEMRMLVGVHSVRFWLIGIINRAPSEDWTDSLDAQTNHLLCFAGPICQTVHLLYCRMLHVCVCFV